MVASNNHSDVEEEDEEEELFALQHHLDCMWRSCWLASVACVGLFSSAYPIVFVFFLDFLLTVCIIGLQLVFSICTVVSFPIWFVDVFGWFAWRRGCEINRGRARAEHIMIVNTNLDSVSKMNWEWNKTFTYTRSIWCWQKKGCRYEFSWCNPKLLWPLVFQTDLSWLLGIGWYRLGYRWAIPRIQYVKFAQSFLHFWYSIIHWFIGVNMCECIYMQISCSSFSINSFHRIRCFQCTVPAKWPQGLQTHNAKTDWFCTGN